MTEDNRSTKKEPLGQWLLGMAIICAALGLFGWWFGKAAGLF